MDTTINVYELTKRFGELTAVDHVSFSVYRGEFFGLLGPNGAGKTTLIRMLTTLMKPTSGRAVIAGHDLVSSPDGVRRSIGVVPQAMTSDLDLTGYENMDIYASFYDIPKEKRRKRIKELLEMIGLSKRANDLVATYSGGMRRRLELVRALVHEPHVLFLDEPTLGLDPQTRRAVWSFLENLKKDGRLSIFLTTHYMEEADMLCDRVGIIDHGKIIALDSPENLKATVPGKDVVILELLNISRELLEDINRLDFVISIEREDNTIRISVENGPHSVPTLVNEITKYGGVVTSVTVRQRSLEDVFIHYTGRLIRDEEAKKVSLLLGAGVPQKMEMR
ncbi:MAG: ATP-binding cassette domain-containing protein [Nitrospirae bacterium]|nr:MAG: ATP-binding cassette domain-containing protein [Nitrospirota bacterium]